MQRTHRGDTIASSRNSWIISSFGSVACLRKLTVLGPSGIHRRSVLTFRKRSNARARVSRIGALRRILESVEFAGRENSACLPSRILEFWRWKFDVAVRLRGTIRPLRIDLGKYTISFFSIFCSFFQLIEAIEDLAVNETQTAIFLYYRSSLGYFVFAFCAIFHVEFQWPSVRQENRQTETVNDFVTLPVERKFDDG